MMKEKANLHSRRPSVSDLQDNPAFTRLVEIGHNDLIPFVQQYYFRLNPVTILHYAVSLASLAAWILSVSQADRLGLFFTSLGLGILAFLPVLPLHEAIHGLVYWLLGARDIRFGFSLRKLYIYAVAHEFVTQRDEFIILALAPFALINAALLGLAVISSPLRPFALALLLSHISGTSGDFALLSYLWEQRGQKLYTYDDADHQVSYFYAHQPI